MPRAKARLENFDIRLKELFIRASREPIVFRIPPTPDPLPLKDDELPESDDNPRLTYEEWLEIRRRRLNVLVHRFNSFRKLMEEHKLDGWEISQRVSVRIEPSVRRPQRVVLSPKDYVIKEFLDQIPDIEPTLPEGFGADLLALQAEIDKKKE